MAVFGASSYDRKPRTELGRETRPRALEGIRFASLREPLFVLLIALGLGFVGRAALSSELAPSDERGFLEAMGVARPPVSGLPFVWSLPFVLLTSRGAVLGTAASSLVAAVLFFSALFVGSARFLARNGERSTFSDLAALLATLTVAFMPSFRHELVRPGAAFPPLLVAILPLVLAVTVPSLSDFVLFAACALALGSSPVIALATISCALLLRQARPRVVSSSIGASFGAALAAVPLVVLSERPRFSTLRTLVPPREALVVALHEIGPFLLVLLAAGVAVHLRRTRDWKAPLALTLIVPFLTLLSSAARGPEEPFRLAALAFVVPLLALALASIFRALASLELPYARTSAGFLVLLTSAAPLMEVEEALLDGEARAKALEIHYDDHAFVDLPKGALVFLSNERLHEHLLARRITGALPKDTEIVRVDRRMPHDLGVPDETLTEVLRDLVFEGRLRELALTKLADARPVFLVYDAAFDKVIARHLTPAGPFDRFMAEPRAPSDRRIARDGFKEHHDALAASLSNPLVRTEYSPILELLTLARMDALRAVRDKESLSAAEADLTTLRTGEIPRVEITPPAVSTPSGRTATSRTSR